MDVKKFKQDCKLRSCRGIMVINENTIVGEEAMNKLQKNHLSVIRIKPNEEGSLINP
jgi:hypothetical protein